MTLQDEYRLEPVPEEEGLDGRYGETLAGSEEDRCHAVFLHDASGSMMSGRDALAQSTYRKIEERLGEEYNETAITYALYTEGIEETVDRDTFYSTQQQSGGDDAAAAYRDALAHVMTHSAPGDDRYIVMATDRQRTVLGIEDALIPDDAVADVTGTAHITVDPESGKQERARRATDGGFVTTMQAGNEEAAAAVADAFQEEITQVHTGETL